MLRHRNAPFVAASAWYAAFIASGAGRVDGEVAFPLFDDAMISMTYARNLANGDGLVWNAGVVAEPFRADTAAGQEIVARLATLR